MRINRKVIFLIAYLAFVISCQKEISTIVQPNQDEVLNLNSTITLLVKKTVTFDGSKDNIIDNASCISIQLPVNVVVNGTEILINSEDDFEAIEAIFDAFSDDNDNLQIIFPIEIILSDFSKVLINNYDELSTYTMLCNGNNEYDEDIECIDFKYPIVLSIFNTESQISETVTILNDEQFYNAIEAINNSQIIEIQFPITVILYDGTEEIINNMVSLQSVLEEANNSCDEDDDNDYNDDDCIDCTVDGILDVLKTCSWEISDLKTNGIENNEQYSDYMFTFLENGVVLIKDDDNEYQGSWSVFMDNFKIIIQLNFENFPDFSFNWILNEIEENKEVYLQFENNELSLEKECD